MRKSILLISLLFFSVVSFAQDSADLNKIEIIQEKGTLYTLQIEYTPSLDEAWFVYTIPSSLFEQGEAMKIIREKAQTFTKERGYFFYTYMGADITKYDYEKKVAKYMSHIKFLN
jgi:hypothetical protein